MTQSFRNTSGGLIDRTKPISFTFEGKTYQGYEGDTLASALLANGVRVIGRSFKYHRPRGIFGSGVEDPNAAIQLRTGAYTEPNVRATEVPLTDGLEAKPQNAWPSANFDLGAMTGVFSKLFPAGFYYKTFMWPAKLWMTYEHVIRHIAGMGKAPTAPDPDRYAHRFDFCDILVVGGGPAGIMAAKAAAATGARVILCDDQDRLGGSLLGSTAEIDGAPGTYWAASAEAELTALPNVTVLTRTRAGSYYDDNMLVLTESVGDHVSNPDPDLPRHRLWQVRADRVVIATGAIERPMVFSGNDRPGVMLTSAAQAYAKRYGVRAGDKAVVFTNNCSAYGSAADLQQAGITIQAIIDVRADVPPLSLQIAKDAGIGVIAGAAVCGTGGKKSLTSVTVMRLNEDGTELVGDEEDILCDLLCLSGGWTPSVHLHSQAKGKLRYDEHLTAFVPSETFQAHVSAGACNGVMGTKDCLDEGAAAGAEMAAQLDRSGPAINLPKATNEAALEVQALWSVPFGPHSHDKRFVDHQNDVTAEDVALAHREGFISVEHLKRYTTLGMGTDQGRTSNVNGLALMAGLRDQAIPDVGTTTFRPPYTPIPMGAVAGPEQGQHFKPTRYTALHDWHAAHGSAFVQAGLWMRPEAYRRPGESVMDAAYREVAHVRSKVGIADVSTLGKIDVQGADAAEFLNRIYVNKIDTLKIGKCRYGVMLREDGIAYDDGTITRLAENRFLLTTTTGHAGPAMQHLEYFADVIWPELDVHMVSVTEEYTAIAVAGPDSRTLLMDVLDDVDLSNEALPFMSYTEAKMGGVTAKVFRISFSGELAYEIALPADVGLAAWERLMEAGAKYDIAPYGMEALGILRIEKGYIVHAEMNGRVTPGALGFDRMIKRDKPEFVGKGLLDRPHLTRDDGPRLVGLKPKDGRTPIPRGAQLIASSNMKTTPANPIPMLGAVTSTCESPTLGHPIALALLDGGDKRTGDTLYAASPLVGKSVAVEVCDPVFFDPKGDRLRG